MSDLAALTVRLGSELRHFLLSWKRDLRARRDYRNLLDVEAAEDIAADLQPVAAAAYTAQQADLEAARLLRESLADGKLTTADIPLLEKALAHIGNSAAADQQIAEALA